MAPATSNHHHARRSRGAGVPSRGKEAERLRDGEKRRCERGAAAGVLRRRRQPDADAATRVGAGARSGRRAQRPVEGQQREQRDQDVGLEVRRADDVARECGQRRSGEQPLDRAEEPSADDEDEQEAGSAEDHVGEPRQQVGGGRPAVGRGRVDPERGDAAPAVELLAGEEDDRLRQIRQAGVIRLARRHLVIAEDAGHVVQAVALVEVGSRSEPLRGIPGAEREAEQQHQPRAAQRYRAASPARRPGERRASGWGSAEGANGAGARSRS